VPVKKSSLKINTTLDQIFRAEYEKILELTRQKVEHKQVVKVKAK